MDCMELLKKACAGDREAKNQLVEENMGLVWSVVKRFAGRGYDREDLFQIGCIGLMKAIDHFDMSYQVKLSTYAVPMIAGEIKRFLRDDGMIKVSRSMKENGWKIKRASEELSQKLGRSATIDEIAAATELTAEEIVLATEAGFEVDSLDRTMYESEGRSVSWTEQVVKPAGSALGYVGNASAEMGSMVNENGAMLDSEKEVILNQILLEELMDKLEDWERRLIEYRYFQDMTQTQVAERLGLTQVQVSRAEKKILRFMRSYV